ncbi:hypothetical protein [Oscillibacter hominis]|nr:hypothetical protein [Oscillibacter hominis]
MIDFQLAVQEPDPLSGTPADQRTPRLAAPALPARKKGSRA